MWVNVNGNTSAVRPSRFRLDNGLTATNLTDQELASLGWTYQEDQPVGYIPPNEGTTVNWTPGFDISTSTVGGQVL